MSTQQNSTVVKMFALVAFFILLFGGAAIYAALHAKSLKAELEATKTALELCEKGEATIEIDREELIDEE